jgi:nitrate/TMAO reductase-like tetraheme cytochrome c subunit
MLRRYVGFVKGVSVNRLGKAGVVLTTSSLVTFVLLELARAAGAFTNAYGGLITYLTLPLLFVIGLVLLPIAWVRQKKATGLSTPELIERQFSPAEKRLPFYQSPLLMSILGLTALNVVFLVGASSRMLSFMDTPHFCGTACHSVMHPEWVTYQDSPHARVQCVDCHVGQGIEAIIDSKLNGMWQIISVTFGLYEKPIPTPVRQLRPAQETCEQCHWPSKFYGQRLKEIVRYDTDSASTPLYTTLALKVDAGAVPHESGIHWHIAEHNEVRYVSVNDDREVMIWVEMLQPDGSYKRFVNEDLDMTVMSDVSDAYRVLDCVDCHNRATHVYENPETAVDARMRKGLIPRDLPYVKREALKAVSQEYPDSATAMRGIEEHIQQFYRSEYDSLALVRQAAIDSAVAGAKHAYRRNVHHAMNVRWNTYLNHIGHEDDGGCFRCHNESLVAADGETISTDCSVCHEFATYESAEPFEFGGLWGSSKAEYAAIQPVSAH